MKLLMNTQQCQETSRPLILKTERTFGSWSLLQQIVFKMADARVNDLDQELFSELTEPLVQPLLIHVVPPFAYGKDPNYCLQINGNVLWEWRTVEGNLKKLYAVLQRNLRLNGYLLEASLLLIGSLCYWARKRRFSLTKLKKRIMGNGEGGKKPILYPTEISHSPYDILACRKIKKHQWGSLNYFTRPKIKISYSMVRAELSGIERHLFPVIIKSVIFFV